MLGILKKLLGGSKYDRDVKSITPLVAQTNAEFAKLQNLSHDELRNKTLEFREYLKEYLADIDHDIASATKESEETEDMFKKNDLFKEIDELKKNRDKKVEEALMHLLPEAFAVVKEAARRLQQNPELVVTATDHDRELAGIGKDFVRIEGDKAIWSNTWTAAGVKVKWDMLHYDVQIIGGTVLHQGKIAEMATGEGKTLVATFPAYLNGLTGLGVHIVTVNNYLARRDCEWMGPLYQFLLLTCDCIDNYEPHSEGRKKAYRSDICYGTNNEFGFDYLRDNMARSMDDVVQRKFHYAMVDEVDSVLVDDARTPLIISGPVGKDEQVQQYQSLKPRIERLVDAQKQVVAKYFNDAKRLISEGNTGVKEGEGGLALLRAHRGLPKYRPLIKFLSEPGMQSILLKTENYYLQEQQKHMPFADEPLFFIIEEKHRNVELKERGVELITQTGEDPNLFVLPDIGSKIVEIDKSDMGEKEKLEARENVVREFSEKSELLHSVNQMLKAYTLFDKDDEYVVIDGLVKIVDEQTGRIMEGRRYSDGLHQAIEAKENVKIEDATQTYATVTLQNFFRMYHKIAGMTGTAETEAQEFWDIYKLDVVAIPPNRKIVREDRQDLVYKTDREKYNALVDDIIKLREAGRPVLVGTTSVQISELLSRFLKMKDVPHNVLNAKQHQREAEIVAQAGMAGQVTIATNMAGRGTDIKLGPGVKEAGGLAIIGSERHDSRRVDRQLRGRAGRQGDPGSSQFYVSLEDKLMRLFGSERIASIMDRFGHKEGDVIQHSMVTNSIERAQRKVEENNFGVRKRLLEYDNVMNVQREAIYTMRNNALRGDRLGVDLSDMFYKLGNELLAIHRRANDYDGLCIDTLRYFGIEPPFSKEQFGRTDLNTLGDQLHDATTLRYQQRMEGLVRDVMPVIERVYNEQGSRFKDIAIPFFDGKKGLQVVANMEETIKSKGKSLVKMVEKSITLAVIDHTWKDHLRVMDQLKDAVQTSAQTEQKDPLVIYKKEAYAQFEQFIGDVNRDVTSFLFHGVIQVEEERDVRQAQAPQRARKDNTHTNREEDDAAAAAAAAGREERAKQETIRRTEEKVGRNDACPCGSGKKYKQCHGK